MAQAEITAILSEWFAKDPEAVADEGVLEFLSGFLLDETTDEDPEQLEMYLDCYSPQFAASEKEQKSEQVSFLLKSARDARDRSRSKPSSAPSSSANPLSQLTSIGSSVQVKPKTEEAFKRKTELELLTQALIDLKIAPSAPSASSSSSGSPPPSLARNPPPSSSSSHPNKPQSAAAPPPFYAEALELRDLLGIEDSLPSSAPDQFSVKLTMNDPCPCLPYLIHLIKNVFKGSMEDAASFCLDKGVGELQLADMAWRRQLLSDYERKEDEREEALKTKKSIAEKFLFQEVKDTPTVAVPLAKPLEEKNERVRYHNGQVVSTRGEKYVVEKLAPDWDGGSRGKVYTKGKRGKGFH